MQFLPTDDDGRTKHQNLIVFILHANSEIQHFHMSHTTVLIYVVIYEYLLIFFFLNYNLPYLLGTTYILFFNRLLEIRCYEIEF